MMKFLLFLLLFIPYGLLCWACLVSELWWPDDNVLIRLEDRYSRWVFEL